MTTLTKQEMLDNVETAINNLISGAQSYTINGRTFQRADLDKLIKWRDQLKREIAVVAGSGRTYVKFVNTD
jgi:hypothetical protein